ncbi:hypothetical protein H8S37_13050 [Mediterraneibacter sp. NSJ-55]|uniref:Uncharacterized protein n=1 Tax=Mediterraneibacter hominis TaxID=2763054 RepID=A0A923RT05_9FIRM|nr:hypothetical protein [Mediterraneibacter hominis]MBC5689837.1 hypothetical protein [Mediterraneibacter hominis]
MSLKGITIETAPEKEAHINASDDRAIWEAVIGMDGVIDVGEKLRGELITNNQFRIYDGALAVGGAIGRIPFGEYEDVVIENGTQNQYRNDFVVAQIEANTSVEEMKIVYIKGVPGETAEDPEYISGNIYKNETCRQYPLYRIKLNGLNVESVEPLFNVIVGIKKIKEELEQLNANYIVEEGENDNGHYRKWNNGTLEMWGAYLGTFSIPSGNVVNGIYYSADKAIPFPVESKTTARVVATVFSNGLQWLKTSTGSTNKTGFAVVVIQPTGANPTLRIHWCATGTWK